MEEITYAVIYTPSKSMPRHALMAALCFNPAMTATQTTELLHFHDPMCSWCWAFRPTWQQLRAQLPADLPVRRIVGGLAPDSDVPMDPAMRAKLESIWKAIQARVPGTQFNFDFWTQCTPRRSTYNACRAVLAAKKLDPSAEERMILAIQEAYYLNARNPSDVSTLVELAGEIGLDAAAFAATVSGPEIETLLQADLAFARRAPINGFPSLLLQTPTGLHAIDLDYLNPEPMRLQIEAALGGVKV